MKPFWRKLITHASSLGTGGVQTPDELAQRVFFNRVVVTTQAVLLWFIFQALLMERWLILILQLTAMAACFVAQFLQARKRWNLARNFGSIFFPLYLTGLVFLSGTEDGTADYLLVVLAFILVVYRGSPWRFVLAMCLVPILARVAIEYRMISASPWYPPAPGNEVALLSTINAIAQSILIVFLVRHLQETSFEARQKILEQEKKLLDSARLASLGEVAGCVAHEINNPLAVIIMRMTMLRRSLSGGTAPSVESLHATITQVEKTVGRIGRIIKGMKRLAHDGSGDQFTEVRLRQLIDEAVAICSDNFHLSGVDLQVIGDDDETKVECREAQIVQILVNLLSNALDAVVQLAQPKVWIEYSVSNNEIVEVRVHDNGPGIDGAIEHKIMQPFFATKTGGSGKSGTGLGLSISLAIAKSHGGELTLDRERSSSCFLLRIPCRRNDLNDLDKNAA